MRFAWQRAVRISTHELATKLLTGELRIELNPQFRIRRGLININKNSSSFDLRRQQSKEEVQNLCVEGQRVHGIFVAIFGYWLKFVRGFSLCFVSVDGKGFC